MLALSRTCCSLRLGVGIKTRMMCDVCTVHKNTACTTQCMSGGVVKRVTMYGGVTTYQYSEWGCGPIYTGCAGTMCG